jgi:hypothetical protein
MDDEMNRVNIEMFPAEADFGDAGYNQNATGLVVPADLLEFLTQDPALQPPEAGEDLLSDLSNVGHRIVATDDANAMVLVASNVGTTGPGNWASPYGPIGFANNSTHAVSRNGHSSQWNGIDSSWVDSLGTRDTFAFNREEIPNQPPGSLQATYSAPLQGSQLWSASSGGEALANDIDFELSLPANPSQVGPQRSQLDLDFGCAIDSLHSTDVHVLDPGSSRYALERSWEHIPQSAWPSALSNAFEQSENLFANTSQVSQQWTQPDLGLAFTAPSQSHSIDVLEASRPASEPSWERMTRQTPSSSFTEGIHSINSGRLSIGMGSRGSNRLSESGYYLPTEDLMTSGPSINMEISESVQASLNKIDEPHGTGLPPLMPQPSLVPSTKTPENNAFVSGYRVIKGLSVAATTNKRKRTLAPERKLTTKKIRNMGACVRCAMLKESVSRHAVAECLHNILTSE